MIDPTLYGMTEKFLHTILPSVKEGYLIVAVGHGPHWVNGKYTHTQWLEKPFHWPTMADAAVNYIQMHAPNCDVYVCPYLQKTPKREKGNAAWRALLHCDCDTLVDPIKVHRLGGFYVESGTAGHGHVYAPLEYPVTPVQHDILERGLVAYMNADPGKISDNDVLRPPGTYNHKMPVMSFVTAMP